ncbi:phosphotransferase family protein [Actinosynnema sp. NPDC059797]
MSHTHELVFSADSLVKRYASWDRGEHRREWSVLDVLRDRAPGLAPEPLGVDLDATPPEVTMTRLPGVPLGGAVTGARLDGLEAALRALWAVPADGLPPRRFHPGEAWRVVGAGFAGATRPGGVAGEAFDGARDLLSGPPPAEPDRPVLGHGDPNLANYLWDGARVRVVDWEDAGGSDVAWELGTLVEHLSARGTDWRGFPDRFDADPARLLAARRVMAAFWLLLLLPGGPAARRNPPGAREAQAVRLLELLG